MECNNFSLSKPLRDVESEDWFIVVYLGFRRGCWLSAGYFSYKTMQIEYV